MTSNMDRRTFLKLMGAGSAALAFPFLNCTGPAIPKHPNIVFILADDMGYGDLSCQNSSSKIPTPDIDNLAAGGMRFTDAHSGSAVCTPTRYGVLTGRYSWRTRLKSGVLWGYSKPLIPDDRMTVASMLQEEGYHTGCVGKWHLGLGWQTLEGQPGPWAAQTDRPENQWTGENIDFTKPLTAGPHTIGFDYFFGIPASLDMVPYCYIENDRVVEPPTDHVEEGIAIEDGWWRAGPVAPGFKHIQVMPTLTEKAVAFIDNHADEQPENPFFLYFPLTAPHAPIAPIDEVRGKSDAGGYGDFVYQVDQTVGSIMDALHRNGYTENTLVIFTSDNGSPARTKKDRSPYTLIQLFNHHANGPWHGIKGDAWDGGHRIPFIARWPEVIPSGSISDETICLTDFIRTCAALVSRALPENAGEDSYNLLPVMRGETLSEPVREATIHHSLDGMFAVRRGEWKLILGRGSGGFTQPRRVDPEQGEPSGQLYNLKKDPEEAQNVYQENPEVVQALTGILDRYREQGRSYPE